MATKDSEEKLFKPAASRSVGDDSSLQHIFRDAGSGRDNPPRHQGDATTTTTTTSATGSTAWMESVARTTQSEDTTRASDTKGVPGRPSPSRRTLSGRAVFLLPESDPQWFQGYFFSPGLPKPWGLLAVQREVDECLQCSEGGYRVIDLTVLRYAKPWMANQPSDCTIEKVEWTGGDMMDLASTVDHTKESADEDDMDWVTMQANKIETGKRVVPTAGKLFGGLMGKLLGSSHSEVDLGKSLDEDEVMEIFPEISLISGTMKLNVTYGGQEGDDLFDD